jgi:hypothetical protein
MGGERNLREENEPADGGLTDLALRVELLSAQRPAPAAECLGDADTAHRLSPMRMKADANG